MKSSSNFQLVPGDVSNLGELRNLILEDLARHKSEYGISTRSGKSSGQRRRSANRMVSEPYVRQYMVLPILNWMGWGNLGDSASLVPEYKIGSAKRVDYVCRANLGPKLVVECKAHQKGPIDTVEAVMQTCDYGNRLVVDYSVLTDGVRWHVYDTFKRAPAKERLVRSLDLRRCSTEEAAGFFRLLTKEKAAEGRLKISAAAPKTPSAASKRIGRKRVNRRVSLNTPEIRRHVDSLVLSFGCKVRPADNTRNLFVTSDGDHVRFCVSATAEPMFNMSSAHLEHGLIYLVHTAFEHGWLLPADRIRRFLKEHGLLDKTQWTIKVTSGQDGDFLWFKKSLPPLPLTSHRHKPGSSTVPSRAVGGARLAPLENRPAGHVWIADEKPSIMKVVD